MSHPWNQTITIDENKARRLIEKQHHIDIETISLLDQGWDNSVFLVNKEIIFRFPRREMGVVCMENEIALLPLFAKHVSFLLPELRWIGQPSDEYKYPFAGYPLIPGKPLCDVTSELIHNTDFAVTLATWLKQLHAIPVTEEYESRIQGDQTWRLKVYGRLLKCENYINDYESYFAEAGFEKQLLLDTIARLQHLQFSINKTCYLHGDLYSRHCMVNPSTLLPIGLIDWGDTHVGYPGIDLAVGMMFAEKAFQVFLDTYENWNEETLNLIRFHAFCHTVSFLPYTYEVKKASLQRWAKIVLERAIENIRE